MEDNKRHKALDDLFTNLPLPDEDRAWQDMKARLEKDDGDRFIVLPPFLQGCAGWTLLLALLLGGALWFYFRDGGKGKEHQEKVSQVRQTRESESRPGATGPVQNRTLKEHTKVTTHQPDTGDSTSAIKGGKGSHIYKVDPQPATINTAKHRLKEEHTAGSAHLVSGGNKKKAPVRKQGLHATEVRTDDNELELIDTVSSPVRPSPADSLASRPDTTVRPPVQAVADSVSNTAPPKEVPRKKYRLAAGLALQQQVPFDGQEWTPYNYRGRKGSLADYIPSVYLRLHHAQKWFLQSEFKYGAPQYTKEFVYKSEVKTDTFGTRSSTAYRLKKTYYHQLPLSFHIYVHPSWSVGTGMVYNRFYGAVSDREVRLGTPGTADTLVSKELVLDKNGSLFRSTNLQWLLETQYRWKRWSVGGRFTQGLQPYIEYVDEQGQNQREKNHSLQLFIRYELWTSKKQ